MSDLQFKFDNAADYGGTTTWTVPLADMPDYPYEYGRMIEERFYRADEGALWTYRKYTKQFWILHLVEISDASKGTWDALLNFDNNFLFIDDVNDSGATHIVRHVGNFEPRGVAYGYWTFDVRLEEV